MSSIFGGSKQKQQSSSSNRAYDAINSSFSPLLKNAATGINAYNALLNGDTSGFDTYKQNAGYDFQADQGSRGITGNAAAAGLLRSGSTGKALANYGANLNNQFYNNYMDKLLQQAQLGFTAGNSLTAAGQTAQSSGSSKSKPGIGGLIGSVASGIAAG